MNNILLDYKSLCAQLLHKEGITNFQIKIEEPSDPLHKCQLLITDNETGENFMLIVVRGEQDIIALMPDLIAMLKEIRNEQPRQQ